MRTLWAFLKKDFLNEASYGIPFLFNIAAVLASSLSYYYIDRLFGNRMNPHLEEFGTGYFGYVLVGMAFFSYVGVGIGSFSDRIRNEQTGGTLEAVIMTPVRIPLMLAAMALWNLAFATLDLLLYLALGIWLFGLDFSRANPVSVAVILMLTVSSFSSLGILSAGFLMIFKRGNPFGWLVGTAEGLLGGVYFPVTVLPAWLQTAAWFLPITHAVRAIQHAIYRGASPAELRADIGFLLVFSAICVPLSVRIFSLALRKNRRDGTLAGY